MGQNQLKKYSQGEQDGIIQSIFEKIGTTNKVCVEFGFNSTDLTGGTGPNTARLILDEGWHGILFDAYNENPEINLHNEWLTQKNIGRVFLFHKVPAQPDYVSIDVDGDDLWLFRGMLLSGYRPRVISVEYNARFPISVSATVKEGTRWTGDAVYGASMLALCRVAVQFGYTLVDVQSGLDLFFVRNDLWTEEKDLSEFEKFTNIHVHPVPTLKRAQCFVEFPSMEPLKEFPWWFEDRVPAS